MSPIPTRVLAGVTVPDTPLIAKTLAYARKNCDDLAYNHVVRSWLLGLYIADRIPGLQDRDVEVHSIAAILHDLGWSNAQEFISTDKRFEVDGANAARTFLEKEGKAEEWDKHRLQLVWDAIALHTTQSIVMEKEPEVKSCAIGINADFTGPEMSIGGVLTRDVWDGILREYPRIDFKEGVKRVLCGICIRKPETTYDNFAAHFGIKFVEGYTLDGHRMTDFFEICED